MGAVEKNRDSSLPVGQRLKSKGCAATKSLVAGFGLQSPYTHLIYTMYGVAVPGHTLPKDAAWLDRGEV